jgi:hypothetical protein
VLKLFRGILLALLASLLLGLVIGTVIRLRLERPVIYFVYQAAPAANDVLATQRVEGDRLAVWRPGDVGNCCAEVLGSRHHEEQIG